MRPALVWPARWSLTRTTWRPSKWIRPAGDRVKTDARDAAHLTRRPRRDARADLIRDRTDCPSCCCAREMTSCNPPGPGVQRPQKRRPKRPVVGIADLKAQHFTAAAGGHADGDDHCLRHHPVIHAGLAAGGVQEDTGEALLTQRSIPELGDFSLEFLASPRGPSLPEIPVSAPSALTRSSTLRVDVPRRQVSFTTANRH